MSRFQQAVESIDRANAEDPNTVTCEGETIAKELLYGQRMTSWLSILAPTASETLALACRASHVRRWDSARADFPPGKVGYKKWRSELLVHHAKVAVALLEPLGYSQNELERIAVLIQKRGRSQDADVQTLEDVACLVFLAHEFDGFLAKHDDDDKLVHIVAKTWTKMSTAAHEQALEVELSPRAGRIVKMALEKTA